MKRRLAALLCLLFCLAYTAPALAAQDYEWTADDYIWTMRSKRVNGVPIGDAIEAAFANVEWSVATDGTDVYGVCEGGAPGDDFSLLVRFTSEFSFEFVSCQRNGRELENSSQLTLEALQTYAQNHRCDACAGLGYTDACMNCAGSGFAFGKQCLACGGSGRYLCKACRGFGVMTSDYTRACPFCDGTGASGACSTCGGNLYVLQSGMLLLCPDCTGSGVTTCSVCSPAGIALGYLVNS